MLTRRTLMRAAIGSALVTAGCSSSPSNQTNGSANKPLDKVTHATGFGTQPEASSSYVAVDKGFFREAGIEVTIVPGAGVEVNLGMLGTGKVDFTEIDYSGALIRAGNGQFDPFRCVAATYRQTLTCIVALSGKGIVSPVDLEHKTIAQQAGAVQKMLFPAYARLAGFDASTVNWVNGTPQTLPSMLASGSVNAIGSYVTTQPLIRHATGGKEITVLPYSTYLTDLYGGALVTSKKLIDTNPNLVHRYTGAILKGLDYSVKNPDEAAAILKKAAPTTEINGAIAGFKALTPYVGPDQNGGAFGEFDQGKVARGIALLQGLGLYPNGFAPERVVDFGTISAVPKAQ